MNRVLKALCLLMALLLVPMTAPAESATQSAPTIRVLLRRLALTDRADITLDGVYTAEADTTSMAFPKGSELVIQIREGQLYLFYQGMSLCLGSQVRFVCHQSEAQSGEGIRFHGVSTFYPGDLMLSMDGGVLMPVLTISVEDYLLGVVPYEMSNDFPLEALKAQAVCARTYALSHVDTSKAWDVVDTTNDQVFKGVDLTLQNAVRAVQETAGVVGTYNNELATCYYSASNGGQTELVENVWSGRGDWSYYQMVDDPYDLENPTSVVKRARLNKSAANLPTAFTDIVCRYMESELKAQGFDIASAAFRMDSISSMSLGGAKFAEPSRYVTELTLTFTWSGRKIVGMPELATATAAVQAASAAPSDSTAEGDILLFATPSPTPTATLLPSAEVTPMATDATQAPTPTPSPSPTPEPTPIYSDFIPVTEPATLTIPLFPEVIRALKLSISGSDNEMVTLTENDSEFVLEARRFGHGVGMSQRGAQWMASQYGKTFPEILSFYYPGMVLMRVASGDPVLPTAPAVLANSPAPAATPTPRPTLMPVSTEGMPEGAYIASVEGIEDDSSLNLRTEPNTASDIIMRLYKHQLLMVVETLDDGWVRVKTDTVEGYVMVSFLEPVQ